MPVAARFQTSLDRLMAHSDRDVRLQAARCVGRLPGTTVIARLHQLAEDPDVHVRREALRTLSTRAPHAARDTLRRVFEDETDLECRRAALTGLVGLRDRAAMPAIRRLIRNPDAFIYEQSPASQASRQALCCEAVQALAELGDPAVVPDLVGLLDRHVSPALDDAVIRTLAHLGDAGRAAIGTLVREAPAHRARSAVEALATCADLGQTDALAMFLSHDDGGVRIAAASSLARIAPSHSALLRRAHDDDPAVRALVAEHAGPTMPSVLELLLDDPEPEVVCAALAALARLPAGDDSSDLLWRLRTKLRSAVPEIACRAAITLAAVAPDAAVNDLADRLGDSTAPTVLRLTAARLLAAQDRLEAAPHLALALFSDNETLRHGILDALTTIARRSDAEEPVIAFLTRVLEPESGQGEHRPRLTASAAEPMRLAVGLAEAPGSDWNGDRPIQKPVAVEVRRQMRCEVAERLGGLPSERVALVLARIAADKAEPELRRAAALALAQVAEALDDIAHDVVAVGHELISDEASSLRLSGLRILAATQDPAHAAAIVDALDDVDPAVRACAARWMGEASMPVDASIVARLEDRLKDRNTAVRLAAMTALARRRGDSVAGLIIDATLSSGDENVPAVAQCLARLDAEIVHHELARRLALASSRDRQLALLRLSDALLAADGAAIAA